MKLARHQSRHANQTARRSELAAMANAYNKPANTEQMKKLARILASTGAVTETETGFKVVMAILRGTEISKTVSVGADGKLTCECFTFGDSGVCAHILAAEIFTEENIERAAAASTAAPKTDGEYDIDRLCEAARQAYAEKTMFAQDEKEGAAWWDAFEKAEREIRDNKTIRFENSVLTIRSRGTGKDYRITEDGCGIKCAAFVAAMPCYHRALYSILSNYYANVPRTYSPRFPTGNAVDLGLAA